MKKLIRKFILWLFPEIKEDLSYLRSESYEYVKLSRKIIEDNCRSNLPTLENAGSFKSGKGEET